LNRPAEGALDIAVADGWIAAIGKGLGEAAEVYDAGGRLVCAGLIETHIHLDKSRIIDRCPPPPRDEGGGRRVNPVTMTAPLKKGAPVLGGAPRYDSDPAAQIDRIFALAREFDVDLDLHLDVGDSPEGMLIHQVLALTERYGRGGRVVAGHMAKLSLLPPAEVAALARRLADAGIAVTVLPATDLYLMGRERDHAVVRGVADANLLAANGVTCSLSSNNVLNAATPYGDCNLIRMANMHANLLQIAAPDELRALFGMLTDRSARLLNLKDYGLAPGNPADLVVIDASSPEQTIAEIR